jgi:rhodanese-related sulfurtransferase
MPNFYSAPEVSVHEVQQKLKNGDKFILLDVREADELAKVKLDHPYLQWIPLSRIAQDRLKALSENLLDKDVEIVVICHHGIRSAQLTAWLRSQGWDNIYSMDGGLAAFAREIDPSIGTY